MKPLMIGLMILISAGLTCYAQINVKQEACLKEAQEKGLYSTSGRNYGKNNSYLLPQRSEFMKGCMRRK